MDNEQCDSVVDDDAHCRKLLAQLCTFQAVANAKGREDLAGIALGKSSNLISTRLKQIEEHLNKIIASQNYGSQTIERGGAQPKPHLFRGGTRAERQLTRVGYLYLELANDVIPRLREFVSAVRRERETLSHEVCVATVASPWFTYKEAIEAHCEGILVRPLFCDSPKEVVDKVMNGVCDIGIATYIEHVHPPLCLHVWVREPMVLGVSTKNADFRGVRERDATTALIEKSTFLACSNKLRIAYEVDRYFRNTLQFHPARFFMLGSIETVVKGIESNDGISILPAPVLANNRAIRVIQLPDRMPERPIAVICHRDALNLPASRRFLEFFGDALKSFKAETEKRRKQAKLRSEKRRRETDANNHVHNEGDF